MIDKKTILKITKYCNEHLDLENSGQGFEYYYASMPLCVVDSVYSIGVRYEGVTNTINRLCQYYNLEIRAKKKHQLPSVEEQRTTSYFLDLFTKSTYDFLSSEVFGNKQRTSSTNGILKSEAVVKFLSVLKDFGVENYQDVPKLINNESFDFCIKNIPGQRSGISLKYYFMLAGSSDLIKPDRMVIRFLQTASGNKYNLDDCQSVLTLVTKELNLIENKLTPQLLDNAIWNYQRNVK